MVFLDAKNSPLAFSGKKCKIAKHMKKDIHPTYHKDAKAECVCGSSYSVGSTMDSFRVEICSNCHPFFSGNEKVLDTAGRVERFKKRAAVSKTIKAKK